MTMLPEWYSIEIAQSMILAYIYLKYFSIDSYMTTHLHTQSIINYIKNGLLQQNIEKKVFQQSTADWLRITIPKHMSYKLTVGMKVVVQNTQDKRWDHTATIIELLPYNQYCLKMCGSGCICLQNWHFLKPIHDSHHISSQNSSHMIPSPYIPSNTQITTQDPNQTMIEHPPVILPISTRTLETIAADHAPHPSTSTYLVVNQSTVPKPMGIPLALKQLASHNKPGLQDPWFSVMKYFCYFV